MTQSPAPAQFDAPPQVEVARMISAAPRRNRCPELDEDTLKDIGFDNSRR